MTILQIECFVEAAKTGNISRAANKLFLSQQSVSKHIRSLEKELGFALFDRHNMGVRLTQPGQILFDTWEKAVYEHRIAMDKAKDISFGSENSIRIGLLDMGSYNQTLVEGIARFNERFPQLNVEYEFMPAGDLFTELDNGKRNLVFAYESELGENHAFHLLHISRQSIQTGVYLSKKHPLANRPFDLKLLEGQTIGVMDPNVSRDQNQKVEQLIRQKGLAETVSFKYFKARHNLGIALLTGKCITIVYETMFEQLQDKLRFIPIPELEGIGMIDLIWKDKNYTVKARNLADIIQEEI